MRFHTWTLLVAACCGGGTNDADVARDALITDALITSDAAQPDAPEFGSASVRIGLDSQSTQPGAPAAGVKVAVVAPGGAPVIYTTDAQGMATFDVQAGSTVFAVRTQSTRGYVYVVHGVDPGAMISLGAPTTTYHLGPALGTLQISFPQYPTAGPVQYAGDYIDCSFGAWGAGTATYTIYDRGCDTTPRTLHLRASNPASGEVLGYLTISNVAAVPGTITATGSWVAPTTVATSFTNMAAPAYEAQSYGRAEGTDWHTTSVSLGFTGSSGSGTAAEAIPVGTITMVDEILGDGGRLLLAEPGDPTAHTIDGATLLPFLGVPAWNASARTATWTPSAGVTPDLAIASFQDGDLGSGINYRWRIYAPGDTTSIAVPDLPDQLTTYDLEPNSEVAALKVRVVKAGGSSYRDLLSDYDQAFDNLFMHQYRPASAVRRMLSLSN